MENEDSNGENDSQLSNLPIIHLFSFCWKLTRVVIELQVSFISLGFTALLSKMLQVIGEAYVVYGN